MGVPAHDQRDEIFANLFGINSILVIDQNNTLINSEVYNGLDIFEA